MNDKCYFEMNETEAAIKNIMNSLEFANYQIATGNIFAVGAVTDQENIDKINDLTSEISDSLCKALDGVTEIQKLLMDQQQNFQAEREKEHIFMHEVDCADAVSHLQGATVTTMGNIKFDGEDATEIIFKTKDGKSVELIYTMEALLCSEEYE